MYRTNAQKLLDRYMEQQLRDKFSAITDSEVLKDERKYSLQDLDYAGYDEATAIEMVDFAIHSTRE